MVGISKQEAAPETEAASTHKEDRMQDTLASSTASIAWRQQIVAWYAGGPKPPLSVMQEASRYGIADHPPVKPRDQVRALTLAGFDVESVIEAVPGLSPVDIIDVVMGIPDVAYTIMTAHREGYTPLEMERNHGVTRPKVYYWLNKVGVKPHKRSRDTLTTRQQKQIVKAYQNGEPMANIARRFNVSYDQVRYAVRDLNGV